MKFFVNNCVLSSAFLSFVCTPALADDNSASSIDTVPFHYSHFTSDTGQISELLLKGFKIRGGIAKHSFINTEHTGLLDDSPLRGLIRSSIVESDALNASRYEVQSAHAGVDVAVSRLLPEFSFSADIGRSNSRLTTNSPLIDREIRTGSINMNWNLFTGAANLSSVRAAKYSALAADMNYLAQERRTVIESLGIYLQVFANQKLVDSLSGTKTRMKKILRATRHQYKAGFASRTDVAQVKGEIAAIEVQLEQAKQSLQQNKNQWLSRSGNALSSKLKLPKIASLLPKSKQMALRKALAGNPIVSASNYNAKAAKHSSDAAKGQFSPSISLYGNVNTNLSSEIFASNNREWNAGVRLNVPLVNFAATSQYKQSRKTAIAAKYRALDTRRQVKEEVETNWTSYQSFKKQEAILSNRLGASREVVKGIGKEVNAGLRPVSDLLREEIKLTENQIRYFQNEVNKVASAYRIAIHFNDLSLSNFKL